MWFWLIIAVIVMSSIGQIKSVPKKRTRRAASPRDDSALYWAMYQRSEKIRVRFDDLEFKYYETPSKWPMIVKAFDSWLKQEESIKAARFKCIEGMSHTPYPLSTDGLFEILHKGSHLKRMAEFKSRLSKLHLKSPPDDS